MKRQIFWLSKHLVIMLRKKYFNIRKPIQMKAMCLVLDAPVRSVSETGLTGDAAAGFDSAKKDDSIVSAETQD